MTFSIILTTYNSEKYIEEAIKSVLGQTRSADEIILSDDNSRDKTVEIALKYSDRMTIRVNPDGPSGYATAFNNALRMGTMDYVTILHFDDLLYPLYLKSVEEALYQHPGYRFLFVSCNFIDSDGKLINPNIGNRQDYTKLYTGVEYSREYMRSVRVNKHIHRCPGIILHRSLVNDNLKFRKEAGLITDDDFFIRVGKYTNVIGLHSPLASVRHHSSSESGKLNSIQLNKELIENYLFLISQWENNTILGQENLMHYYYCAEKLNFRLRIYSELANDHESILFSNQSDAKLKSAYPKMYKDVKTTMHSIAYLLLSLKLNWLFKTYTN